MREIVKIALEVQQLKLNLATLSFLESFRNEVALKMLLSTVIIYGYPNYCQIKVSLRITYYSRHCELFLCSNISDVHTLYCKELLLVSEMN